MYDNFCFLALKMDLLAQKMTARHIYFSVQGVQNLFPDHLTERAKAIKVVLFIECIG